MSVSIDPTGPGENDGLAAFLWRHNRRADGHVRCLHADQGDTMESYRRELDTLPAGEHLWLLARNAGQWLGVIGAEHEGPRAWVRGPLVADSDDELGPALLRELPRRLPHITRFDAFWQADETGLIATAAPLGWQQRAVFHVMEYKRSGAGPAAAPSMPTTRSAQLHDALAEDHAAAMALHEASFPNTYLPASRLLASLNADHRLLVWREGAEVLGYLYARHRVEDNDGYIDYLAVAPVARGRGVGRGLLLAALHWLCGQRNLPRVSLTVRQDAALALGLYEGVGFRRVASGAQVVFER